MLKLFVSIFAVLLKSVCTGADSPRIIGGQPARLGQFPYVVSLQFAFKKGFNNCAGGILNERWVLSAAHCAQIDTLVPTNILPSELVVFVGSVTLNKYGKYYEVEEIHRHPDWDFINSVNDITMIKLKRKLKWDKTVQPVYLPFNIKLYHGFRAVVAGWGLTSYPDAVNPNRLQYIISKIRDHKNCTAYWGIHGVRDATELCFGGEKGHGMCKGDSGAPLVYYKNNKSFVIGIVARGKPCAAGVPDKFTRVSYYLDWIKTLMRKP